MRGERGGSLKGGGFSRAEPGHAGRLAGTTCKRIGFEREEVIRVGWWRTSSGAVIGDSPADIIEEFPGADFFDLGARAFWNIGSLDWCIDC